MIEETQTTIPEGETAPLPASADLPTAALTSTENAADAPVQTVGAAVTDPGGIDALVAAGANNSQQAIDDALLGEDGGGELISITGQVVEAPALGEVMAETVAEPENLVDRAEDAFEEAVATAEFWAEAAEEEAETLASDAVAEVNKVWNNSLQAWV